MQPANKSTALLDGFHIEIEGRHISLREAVRSEKYLSFKLTGNRIPLKAVTQFLIDNENRLSVILNLFNESQSQLSFGLPLYEEKNLQQDKKLVRKLIRLFIQAPDFSNPHIIDFQSNMQKVHLIASAVKIMDGYHPIALIQAAQNSKEAEDVKTHFLKFLKENPGDFDADSLSFFYQQFIKNSIDNCFSKDDLKANLYLKRMKAYAHDPSFQSSLQIPPSKDNKVADPLGILGDMRVALKEDKPVTGFWEVLEQILDKKAKTTLLRGCSDESMKEVIWLGLEKLSFTEVNDSTYIAIQWLMRHLLDDRKQLPQFPETVADLLNKMEEKKIFLNLVALGNSKRTVFGEAQLLPELLEFPGLSSEMRMKIRDLMATKSFALYAKLYPLNQNTKRIPFILPQQILEIEEVLTVLKLNNAPFVDRFINILGVIKENIKKTEHFTLELDKQGRMADKLWTSEELDNLITLAAILGKWKWIEPIRIKKSFPRSAKDLKFKSTISFLCDKITPPEWSTLEGSYIALTASVLIRMLKQLKVPPFLKSIVLPLQKRCIPVLKDCILFSEMGTSQSLRKLMGMLPGMKPGDKFMIRLGCQGHATLLLVEKTKKHQFCFTHYNTGSGVANWHFRWKETNLYQTYMQITNIKEADVLKGDLWQNLLMATGQSEMDEVYLALESFSKGEKQKASLNKEDYDKRQNSGSCAAQCLMSFFRHQCMLEAKSQGLTLPEEEEAVYKLIKTQLFTNSKDIKKINKALLEKVPTRMEKLGAELHLTEIAENKARFKKAYGKLRKELGLQETDQSVPTSIFARYAALQKASLKLVNLWMKKPFEKKFKDEAFAFAITAYKHKMAQIQNWKIKLNQETRLKEKSEMLFNILQYTPYRQFAVEQLAEFFIGIPEHSDMITDFLDKLAGHKATLPVAVGEIAEHIKRLGNSSLAGFILEYFKKKIKASLKKPININDAC